VGSHLETGADDLKFRLLAHVPLAGGRSGMKMLHLHHEPQHLFSDQMIKGLAPRGQGGAYPHSAPGRAAHSSLSS
jgi:hypothetical protein